MIVVSCNDGVYCPKHLLFQPNLLKFAIFEEIEVSKKVPLLSKWNSGILALKASFLLMSVGDQIYCFWLT
jgi:hypothetical protein